MEVLNQGLFRKSSYNVLHSLAKKSENIRKPSLGVQGHGKVMTWSQMSWPDRHDRPPEESSGTTAAVLAAEQDVLTPLWMHQSALLVMHQQVPKTSKNTVQMMFFWCCMILYNYQQCELALSAHLAESSEFLATVSTTSNWAASLHISRHRRNIMQSTQAAFAFPSRGAFERWQNTTDIHWKHMSLLHVGLVHHGACHLICKYGFRLSNPCNPGKIQVQLQLGEPVYSRFQIKALKFGIFSGVEPFGLDACCCCRPFRFWWGLGLNDPWLHSIPESIWRFLKMGVSQVTMGFRTKMV